MLQNIAVDDQCNGCSGRTFVLDSISGDTICDTCGMCRNDVLLDSFGNAPPTASSLCIQEINSTLSSKSLRKKLDELFQDFDVNPAFEQYGYDSIAHIEQRRLELRGSKLEHACLAIIYQIHQHHGVFFDLSEACGYMGVAVGRILDLRSRLFASVINQRNQINDTTDNKKMQSYIFKAANDLSIDIKSINGSLLTTLAHMPKSTKMKAAVCLYIQDSGKLREILKYTRVQRNQLMGAVAETKGISPKELNNQQTKKIKKVIVDK